MIKDLTIKIQFYNLLKHYSKNTMNRRYILIGLLFLTVTIHAKELPGRHTLKQNEQGEYYIVNHDQITMIEPAIIKFGLNQKWILACIKNKSIDSDLKRWVFLNIQNGGTIDTIDQEKWTYFRDVAYPELKHIKLNNYQDEDCP